MRQPSIEPPATCARRNLYRQRSISTIGSWHGIRHSILLQLARVWAYPLWCAALGSKEADAVVEDVDWWMRCINDADQLALDRYSQFAYLSGALPEFRTLVHYRLRSAPLPLRILLRVVYRPAATLVLDADRIGPALFIQHGVATIVTAKSIGSHCWINQQVTIGFNANGRPTLGDRVSWGRRDGDWACHVAQRSDGRANATVLHDVGPGETVVAPLATPLTPRRDGAHQPRHPD